MKTTPYLEARRIFDTVFDGKRNMLTPDVITYVLTKSYAVEVSHGTMMDDDIYGVTVINLTDKEHNHELSESFNSESEARAYIKALDEVKK